MDYKELDVKSVLEFVQELESIKEYFASDTLSVSEIGDGNLNYVYLLQSEQNPKKALIVKQAVEYLRCVGEEYALSRERMSFEIRALREFYEYLPSHVPKIYYANEAMSLVIMEYLGAHEIMRKGLIEKHKYPHFAEHISTYLASTLFYTSSLYLQSEQKRQLIERFNDNTELCKLTEDFVFTTAYMDDETNDNENIKGNKAAEKLFGDMEFKQKILELKYKFMTHTDALCHGDLHTGSIMLNKEETYVIDPEFAFVGPFGFDIGALLANLVNSYIHHKIVTQDSVYQNYILESIKEMLALFEEKFLALWEQSSDSALVREGFLDTEHLLRYKQHFMKNILRESVGFAGAKIARRVFGVAGVEEIRGIEDKALRAEAEKMALRVARAFVMSYESLDSVESIIHILKGQE